MTNYREDRIGNILKRMRPENGDIILVKRWPNMTDDDQKRIIEVIKNRLNPSLEGVVCIFVDSLGDVRLLDEKVMGNLGWFRKDEKA